MRVLEQYLKESLSSGQDHSVRFYSVNGDNFIQIHPEGKNGDTLVLRIDGNQLFTNSDTKSEIVEKKKK
jgi:hypothetical protein